MQELLHDPQNWAALVTLTVMEIVLGIDNVVFISIAASRLPAAKARRARAIGLSLALVLRLAMLFALTWAIALTTPLFSAFGRDVSWRDLILILGGLFLIYKGTTEIHAAIGGEREDGVTSDPGAGFAATILQIIAIDIIFSIDSIITAIGMAQRIEVMAAAVVIAVAVMYVASAPIAAFIKRQPTTKMLALAFLLLIGVALIADGIEFHIPRGYIYFAMAFSAGVEFFNVLARRRRRRAVRSAGGARARQDREG